MNSFFNDLLGLDATTQTLTIGQGCARAVLVFFVAILLLRLAGRRTVAGNSAMELVVKFMFGALLSRVILADAPMGLTFAAAAALVLVQRVVAYAVYFSPSLRKLIKGTDSLLVQNGVVNKRELTRASISEEDMQAGVRAAANLDDLQQVQAVRLEHDGNITVVKKEEE
ncbi:DUF421 domain-containing protein [Hymenobacter metallilatus]|uniref:DUF421 domain-containing protein n=1 Tax=Hymenobacter metallilatus TaxID=2493666 RepID=A0A3R9NDP0_9BACT|nr:YetF domain-containing protein [Hymenobacter metallilatus]RSK29526.1 DUF421 domain-containing protein [Hymenobacter metallilatus]